MKATEYWRKNTMLKWESQAQESNLTYEYSLLPIHAIKGTENNLAKKPQSF